jgi:hypothetical protein
LALILVCFPPISGCNILADEYGCIVFRKVLFKEQVFDYMETDFSTMRMVPIIHIKENLAFILAFNLLISIVIKAYRIQIASNSVVFSLSKKKNNNHKFNH